MLSEKPRGGLSETRKMTKSTMEKRRRQRINNSLTELKSILSGMITHKGERFDKMEKADILEMTVKCVRQLQKQANTADGSRSPSNVPDEDYKSGMHKCMSEVIKFISSSNFSDADPAVKTKLLDHLANKLSDSAVQPSTDVLYKRTSFSSDDSNTCCSKLTDDFSDTDNDANNNVHSMPGSDPVFPQVMQQTAPGTISPMYISNKPVLPETEQRTQSQTNMQTVPLTILLPANFCSTAIGTTCVIPLNLPGVSPNQLNQPGFIPTVAATSLPTSGNVLPPTSGIPMIANQNAYFATTQTTSAANVVQDSNKMITFSPTVITDNTTKVRHVISDSHVEPAMTSSSTSSATISNALLVPANVSGSPLRDTTIFADNAVTTNASIKKSQSPMELAPSLSSECCSSYTDIGRHEDPSFRAVADSTTSSPILRRDQVSNTQIRDPATECCSQETLRPQNLSPPRNQRNYRNAPYMVVPNAQIEHIPGPSNHWRPW